MIKAKKSGVWLIIFLGWLMYTTSYLGKVNYSANINEIISFYGVTKAEAGTVPTFFFFAYGIGQVVNGILCKRYSMKWMIFASLMTSAIINFTIGVTASFAIIKWLWMINGFAMSVLWPTLIRLLSESLPQKSLGTSSVIIGTTVASGTLIIYALSSIYAAIDRFKLAFFTAAAAASVVAIIWVLLFNKARSMSMSEMTDEDIAAVDNKKTYSKIQQKAGEKKTFFMMVYMICFIAIGVNLIKDGLTTWVPTILKEEYAVSSSLSILLTLVLPIVSIFGNACAVAVHKKIPDYITHCAIIFAIMGAIMYVIIGALSWQTIIILLASMMLVAFLASSLNSLITSVFPMFMRGKVNSGLYAGILNGFCYLGSTVSSYGLGFVADHYGWMAVFVILMYFCCAVCLIWVIYSILKHRFSKIDAPIK